MVQELSMGRCYSNLRTVPNRSSVSISGFPCGLLLSRFQCYEAALLLNGALGHPISPLSISSNSANRRFHFSRLPSFSQELPHTMSGRASFISGGNSFWLLYNSSPVKSIIHLRSEKLSHRANTGVPFLR